MCSYYCFKTITASIDRDTTWATLRVNSNYILDIFAEGHATGHDDQNANTAVVQCNEGDKVWVYGDYGILSGQNDENVGSRTASFSGFLLHPTTV